MNDLPTHRLGPIRLNPGVRPRHVFCYLFAALISIERQRRSLRVIPRKTSFIAFS